jgi:hypothetical protein
MTLTRDMGREAVIFFGAYFLWDDGLQDTGGLDTGFYSMGHAILFVGIFVIFLKLFLHVKYARALALLLRHLICAGVVIVINQ